MVAGRFSKLLLVGMLGVSACSQSVETRIANSGVAIALPMTFQSPEAPGEAQRQVAKALTSKGYKAAANGVLYLEVSWSSRPAALALGSDKAPDDLAKAKGKGWKFWHCAKTEYRLGVTLTRISDGKQLYRSTASEDHCKAPSGNRMADLANAAIADIGTPRGQYIVKAD